LGWDGATAVGRKDGGVIDKGEQGRGAVQVDTTGFHPGSYDSSLDLKHGSVTSGEFRNPLSHSLVSKSVDRERSGPRRLGYGRWAGPRRSVGSVER
jgi:hypothetical protein